MADPTKLSQQTAETTPADTDLVGISKDAGEGAYVSRKVTWANVKATLKTYLDTLYAAVGHGHSVTSGDLTGDGTSEDPLTLASVGSSGSRGALGLTTDSKGRVTAVLSAAPTENLTIETGATTPSLAYNAGYLYADAAVEIQVPTTTSMANNSMWVYKLRIKQDGNGRAVTLASGWALDAADSEGITIVSDANSQSVLELTIHKDNSGNTSAVAGLSWSDYA
jgi:hypothetical protein